MKKRKYIEYILGLLIFINLTISSYCYPQDYKINPEDILEITFIKKPELNKTTKVGLDGNISLPVIGSIKAAGLTTTELTRKIISEFSIYRIKIRQASVEIITYESNKIYVTGHVTNPGKYVFEKIPDLWKVISEAGGPIETANLSNVLIVRSGEEEGQTITVNLAEILQQGDLSRLPKIKPGDNIYISGTLGEVSGRSLEALQQQRHVIYIYGEIVRAGIYTFDQSVNLLQAIITAGGPTKDAKLNDVRIIRKGLDNFSRTVKVNSEWYAEDSRLDFFRLLPGDIVYIPRKKTWIEGLLGRIIINIVIPVSITTLIYELIGGRR